MANRTVVVRWTEEEMVTVPMNLAVQRTQSLLAAMDRMVWDLGVLARSCYLQGLRDMAEAVASDRLKTEL